MTQEDKNIALLQIQSDLAANSNRLSSAEQNVQQYLDNLENLNARLLETLLIEVE